MSNEMTQHKPTQAPIQQTAKVADANKQLQDTVRSEAVADLTRLAITKAGTLQLSPDESKRLMADFPDEAFQKGAGGKDNLIYLEHAALRDRLNEVLGLGQWAIIVRENWFENFTSAKGSHGVRVYSKVMLLVRGCYVSESVGDMDYYPGNPNQNKGDAIEGSKTAAFRRCAKEFGVGLQAWRKEWCAGWMQRNGGKIMHTMQRGSDLKPPTGRRQYATPTEQSDTDIVDVETGEISESEAALNEMLEPGSKEIEDVLIVPMTVEPIKGSKGKAGWRIIGDNEVSYFTDVKSVAEACTKHMQAKTQLRIHFEVTARGNLVIQVNG